MLQLLAAAVAAFSSLQRLFKQTLCFHDGRGFFLCQQDVRRGTTTGGEEESLSSSLYRNDGVVGPLGAPALIAHEQWHKEDLKRTPL